MTCVQKAIRAPFTNTKTQGMHFGLRLLVLLPLCILHLSAPLHSLAPGKLIKSRLCGIFMHEIFIKFLWFWNASKLKTRRDEITSHLINRSDCKDAKIKNDLQGPIVGFGEVKYFLSAGVSIKRHVGVSKWMYFNVLMISQEMMLEERCRLIIYSAMSFVGMETMAALTQLFSEWLK